MDAFDDNVTPVQTGTYRPRYFTVAEANRALVLVKRVVADVVRDYCRLLDLHDAIEAAQNAGNESRFELVRSQLVATADKLHDYLQELNAVGVDLRDWSQGIVDFPSVAGEREVCLCWQHGEPAVECWHEVDEGLAERRPIEQLEAWELLGTAPR